MAMLELLDKLDPMTVLLGSLDVERASAAEIWQADQRLWELTPEEFKQGVQAPAAPLQSVAFATDWYRLSPGWYTKRRTLISTWRHRGKQRANSMGGPFAPPNHLGMPDSIDGGHRAH